MPRHYTGRSSPATKPVAFHTFGEVRPRIDKYVLPVYGDPDSKPFEIVCDTLDVALAHMERLREADLAAFEDYGVILNSVPQPPLQSVLPPSDAVP
jgi:hypothetical protein